METVNPIDKLNILEKKVATLIEVLRAEKGLNLKLIKEKEELKSRLESLEISLLKNNQNLDELNQERALTKMVVDELIGNIDRLVEIEQEKQ